MKEKGDYLNYLNFFFSHELSEQRLHGFIVHLLTTRYNNNKGLYLKLTETSANLGDYIICIMISHISFFKPFFDICDLLFMFEDNDFSFHKNEQIIAIFKKENIKESFIIDSFCLYLKSWISENFKKNNLSVFNLYELLKDKITSVNFIIWKNACTIHSTRVGRYFLDHLSTQNLFSISFHEQKDFKSKIYEATPKMKTKGKGFYIITPSDDLAQNILSKTTFDEPFLTEEELEDDLLYEGNFQRLIYNQVDRILHANICINTEVKETSYFRKKIEIKKYSIDTPYLMFFLEMLNSNSPILQNALLSLYALEPDYLQALRQHHPITEALVNSVLHDVTTFSNCITSHQLISTYEQKLQGENKTHFEKYKSIFVDLINKVYHRKRVFVQLVNHAIKYSIFKFFIFYAYVDSRGRVYHNANALNFHTNPIAKIFVRMYDPSYCTWPSFNKLADIGKHLRFKKSKEELEELMSKNEKEEYFENKCIASIRDYIKTFFRSDINSQEEMNAFLSYIDDKSTSDDTLLNLQSKIKKHKKLFHLHSALYYEQLRSKKRNCVHFQNVIEKDATSSGFQMMSILFKSEQLAKISNLYGDEIFDIYKKAADAVHKNICLLQTCSTFSYAFFKIDRYNFSPFYKIYNNSDLENAISKNDVFNLFLTADTQLSICMPDILSYLLKHITLHLKNVEKKTTNFEITVKQTIPFLDDVTTSFIETILKNPTFKKLKFEVELLFCMRYAMRICIIIKDVLRLDFHDESSPWRSRNLTKDHVMTLV